MLLKSVVRPEPRSSSRRAVLALLVAALVGGAAIMTIMLAQSLVAFVVGYAAVLALSAALGLFFLRSPDNDRP